MRIVSLIASATEIVCALGFEDCLVGRSHECDYPPSVLGLPSCTRPKFDIFGSSAEIDRRVRAAIEERTTSLKDRPTVACIEWIDPLMAGGNWMPELVTMAGGVNVFGEAGRHSPYLTWQQLCERDPDVIVVLPCGWDIAKARQEMGPLIARPEWPHLRAAKAGRVFLTDGNQYFNRPGPRLVESLEILAEVLHPEDFHFGHQGTGWQRL
jgi:iron complex transport system substrate-binding protein